MTCPQNNRKNHKLQTEYGPENRKKRPPQPRPHASRTVRKGASAVPAYTCASTRAAATAYAYQHGLA